MGVSRSLASASRADPNEGEFVPMELKADGKNRLTSRGVTGDSKYPFTIFTQEEGAVFARGGFVPRCTRT